MSAIRLKTMAAGAALALAPAATAAQDFSLAYFMGPTHPMNAAVFEPFAERLAELSGGTMTVQQFPGGALNSSPPKQYSILLDGVADIVFTLPGYTGELFPMTNVVSYPGVCESAIECTQALLNARDLLESEYEAKLLAIWSNAPPVLMTRDAPVTTLEDMAGLKMRVTSSENLPFTEALGASGVAQPVTVIHQNLTNGVIDAIAIDPTGFTSFSLHEPANYATTWFPGSGSAFVLLMNRDVYDGLTPEQQGWIDAASDDSLSIAGGEAYQRVSERSLEVARENGVEFVELSAEERARFEAAIAPALEEAMATEVGAMTIGEVMAIMKGEN